MSAKLKRREFITLVGSAAVAWPLAARAQQAAKTHRIAIVHPSVSISEMNETGDHPYYPALFKELRRLGYVEGKIWWWRDIRARDERTAIPSSAATWWAQSRMLSLHPPPASF